jgi:sulfur carrier protein ThiS adenylyltransferase
MRILLNEQWIEADERTSLRQLRERSKPSADVLIVNGFPTSDDHPLNDGDRVVLICRGEQPSSEELEVLMAARHTPGVHERIRQATVGIAGVGGLGSAVAIALARIGIGHLVIADFDVVEPSNLNRQQFFVDQIGLPKVAAMRDNLARIHPSVRVTSCNVRLTPENIPLIFSEVDVMVEAFDAAGQKAMLTETFLLDCPGKPLVAASGLAGYELSNTVITRRAGRNFFLVGDGLTAAGPGVGLMAPRVGIAAHHQANAVLRLLLGEQPC